MWRGWSGMAVALWAACSPPAPALEVVGDPLGDWRSAPDEAYARGLWDLQAWHGRLYLGYGDAIKNTGPTQVIAFDPATHAFTTETVLDEEAIMTFRVIGDRLFIPGVDAIGPVDGSLYVRDETGWTSRPLAQAVHVLDVARDGDALCVAVQGRIAGAEVRCSHDDGITWESHLTGGWRAQSLFALGGHLYVSSDGDGVWRVGGARVPGGPANGVTIRRTTACGSGVVFIVRRETGRSGVFRASARDADNLAVVPIPIGGEPTDVFTSGDACYVLTDTSPGSAVIFESRDGGRSWFARTAFDVPARATSAELLGGYFYVGLGCKLGEACSDAAGRLLRIEAGRAITTAASALP